jgi:hypothetical protein
VSIVGGAAIGEGGESERISPFFSCKCEISKSVWEGFGFMEHFATSRGAVATEMQMGGPVARESDRKSTRAGSTVGFWDWERIPFDLKECHSPAYKKKRSVIAIL